MAEGWMEARACAKVNLRLRIFPRAADGYHPLETLLCRIDHADRVGVRLWPEPPRIWLRLEGGEAAADVPDGPDNLAYRAAATFAERAGMIGSIEVALEKTIAPGAGLGGGSSDAAAVLRTLEGALDLPGGGEAMMEIATELGADVPFFAADLPVALARGRGERLTAVPGLEPRPMLLALPAVRIATAEAYAAWDDAYQRGAIGPAADPALEPHELADWERVSARAINDFEPVIFARYPELADLRDRIESSGAIVARLSGSGSTVFGIYDSEARRDDARARLQDVFQNVGWVSARGPV
ncbi:MAG: 4-(cytidine 5'-diphospho)-2-C-methyl-D-erythritol kinase [Gemmatimonadetes bacterium]|uniref:4-diphosphocytidyl-2-C-methyl-D-erythritol kinase n=1 Tax=Candidatus Kutchimonas denitrificans TaxID=3056748 RepID=A0AAE4Z9I8_9BACT|nr:4-(cytidine 5'-diphospho)-2-C-methyl-D-erythritol kinase [Gemmatimonadota bacterium]NIR75007.1 4-(cytidine 5'-diphospho)-2-C-methyl-D-erythritol kinase [Candidatus Kutchimonas denitrificans]NIS01590.1 4-(cytidine 5'-diphospho)-2-C-methyl-D-erythritol kinase [Gemmatimonadota bacterium]NIT67328.1 4-(cytidine 5'-diphospho)-2-C-methyl-D-erythritol kinase [Gemmatimonadota bacterium]NIU52691.1 4-(cytidine 5'-diphospho)-2-C-methyl-D-erythritol kinase [Gemmatimonadota bacterium]